MTYRFEVAGRLPAPMRLEFTDGELQVTPWPTVTPEPGGPLWQSYGVCSHPNFANEAYGDTDAWTQKLADLGVYAFRGMCASKLNHVKRSAVRARELGLKWLAQVAHEGSTETELRANLEFILDNADVFVGIEGINEPDGDGLTDAEVTKTVKFQKIIWDFVNAHPELSHLTVLSPALRRPAGRAIYERFVDGGILGTFHAVSLHHYLHGPPDLAELGVHLDMVEGVWRCDRFWITETGGTTAVDSTDPRRNTEAALAAYSIPTILEFLSDPRVEKVFRYELMDDDAPLTNNEAHFGLFRIDGTLKPEIDHLESFLRHVRDETIFNPAEVEAEVIAPEGVRWRVIQSSTGEAGVWLWRPGALHDAAPVDVRILTPAGEATFAVSGAAIGARLV